MVLFRRIEFKNRNIDELLDIQYNQLSSTVKGGRMKDQIGQLIQ